MWEIVKAILLTNNDRVVDKFGDKIHCIMCKDYEEVMIKTRDMVYAGNKLLTHPQASSLKPNQTLYRSIIIYPKEGEDNTEDIMLIEKCVETFRQWQGIAKSPESYPEDVANDFKTIDLSVIENVIPRIC